MERGKVLKIGWKLAAWMMTCAALIALVGLIFGNTPWAVTFHAATGAWLAWMVVHVDGRNRPNVGDNRPEGSG